MATRSISSVFIAGAVIFALIVTGIAGVSLYSTYTLGTTWPRWRGV